MSKALFAGSFDPFTIGHYALVRRTLTFADHIDIAIGINYEKKTLFTAEERMDNIRRIFADNNRITVAQYEGLTSDYALDNGITFIVRGVRNITDFEYEKTLATANYKLSGIETVFLFAEPEYEHISSSLVRELIHYKKDISQLIPNIR